MYSIYYFIIRVVHKFRSIYWSFILKSKNLSISSNVKILGVESIEIGSYVHIGRFSWIQTIKSYREQTFNPQLKIGNGVKTSEFVHIGCADKVTIGDNCLIASKVIIIDHNHGTTALEHLKIIPVLRPLITSPINIGNNVFIGDNVVILPGVSIGDNTVIGAGSIVTKNVPANCVAIGNPAKVLYQRS